MRALSHPQGHRHEEVRQQEVALASSRRPPAQRAL